jgi:predicted amidohydrolase YtcJ
MTRRTRTGTPVNLQERLALPEALALFTTAGAWVGFEEAKKGRIRPGMLADLLVLDRDLMSVPAEEIGNLKVQTTIVGGEIVWSADEC